MFITALHSGKIFGYRCYISTISGAFIFHLQDHYASKADAANKFRTSAAKTESKLNFADLETYHCFFTTHWVNMIVSKISRGCNNFTFCVMLHTIWTPEFQGTNNWSEAIHFLIPALQSLLQLHREKRINRFKDLDHGNYFCDFHICMQM